MSNTYDLVVVGGGPAGHSAAEAYRAAGGEGTVLLVAGERRAPDRRAVTLEGEPESITYKSCVLALGAAPTRPPIPGADRDGVHLLRTLPDAMALRDATPSGARVVVLGSGFIGCEAAASLRRRGGVVTLVSQEDAPQEQRLGAEVAARLGAWLADEGVDARYGQTIEAIDAIEDDMSVRLSDGDVVRADRVLLAGGVAPATDLARAAGLPLADDGGILADASMRTAAPGVLACGDACRAEHALAGRRLHVEHWGDALSQGAVAGWTAAGREATWDAVPGFWSTIGDRTLKHAAWGDGFADVRVVDHDGGGFTAWYGDADGACVGVLAHDRDADYDAGRRLIEQGAPRP